MYLNLHIQDVRMYCHSYRCRKCSDSLWTHAWKLRQHESTCTGCVRRVYPGGVYHSTPSVFERLDDENIRVAESLRYYPYRATFNLECWFDTEQLPSDSDKVHWVARHVPLSVRANDIQRQGISSTEQSIQKADGTTLWMDASLTRHWVQFG